METETLLNIKPKTSHSSNAMTEQTQSKASSDKNKANDFKSALKSQVNKESKDIPSDKKLPQDGNELPEKKVATDQQDKQMDSAQVNKHEPKNVQEQPANQEQPVNQEPDQENQQNADNYSEQVDKKYLSPSEIISVSVENEAIEQNQVEADELSDPNLISVFNTESATIPLTTAEQSSLIVHPDNLLLDKKNQSESTKGQFDFIQSSLSDKPSSNKWAIDSASANNSGSNNKNESPLSKSIAEFQQFIDMSKKNSMAGEAISSIKVFEQGMKTEQANAQINAQLLLNEIKLPSGHNAQATQTATAMIPVDNLNSPLNTTSLSFSKTMASFEVKTPVGKAGWNQSFSNQIIMMTGNGIQQAKIKLNPMSLGPVEAMVKLSGETAVVNLTSLHLTTKDALENAIPRLKEMLNENGFSRVDVDVSHQDKNQQQEAALENKDGSKTSSNNEHGNSTMPGDEQLSEETLDSESAALAAGFDDQGLKIVDYYA